MTTTFVIVGGDAAGMSAASKIKRNLPDAEVLLFERGPYISYSACGMPYWIEGIVPTIENLVMVTPEKAQSRRGVNVQIHHEVTAIDSTAQTVTVQDLQEGQVRVQPYHRLIVATGASALKPPIPGADLPGVFTLRSLSDGQQLYQHIDTHQPRRALVVGGGYIGLEMAEALRARKMEVTLVEMLPQIMPNLDQDILGEVTAHLIEQGVQLRFETQARQIVQQTSALVVTLADMQNGADDETLEVDLVLLATGVRPNVELAKTAGLDIGQTGAIWVDAQMRTSDPHIYAAGDCVEHHHLVLGENGWIPLATSANKGGRIAGDNASGGSTTFPGILGTAVVKVFDYTLAVTGLTEAQAKASGKFTDVGSAVTQSYEKSVYWPGAEKMQVKLIFNRDGGRVLGCQMVGKQGVNKRIDIVATAITAGMTVSDLAMLDLSYAPPYSPTYDPIHICAGVAQKQIHKQL